ncbi:hypothetical protein [Serinicoccus marinus]|uniref:hypothetical protein n=1 Tax=Serinicoccus marinus TaxID=247333 RepID=UPI00122DC894|nr:hypothetical protein [Serinicoccus marinus]
MSEFGVRLGWADLPERVHDWAEQVLGARVVRAESQPTGFSPGSADRVETADGRRAFVKAVSSEQNPDSPGLHRREVAVLRSLSQDGLAVPGTPGRLRRRHLGRAAHRGGGRSAPARPVEHRRAGGHARRPGRDRRTPGARGLARPRRRAGGRVRLLGTPRRGPAGAPRPLGDGAAGPAARAVAAHGGPAAWRRGGPHRRAGGQPAGPARRTGPRRRLALGLPTLRAFQRSRGEAAVALLRELWPD